jgi:hypothetical protein
VTQLTDHLREVLAKYAVMETAIRGPDGRDRTAAELALVETRAAFATAIGRLEALERYIDAIEAASGPCDWDCTEMEMAEFEDAKAALAAGEEKP